MTNLIVDFPQGPRDLAQIYQDYPRVSFAGEVDMKFVENLSITHDKADLYFTDREIKSFKLNVARLLRDIRSLKLTVAQYAEINVSNTSAFMGIENHLSEQTTQGILNRRRSIRNAVLAEQDRQMKAKIYDPDEMAKVSQAESERSRLRAHLIGMMHASDDR